MNATFSLRRAASHNSPVDSSDLCRWPYTHQGPRALPETLPGGRSWPKISIVTPSFNQGRYIEETILSVLNQNYPNVEHLIIDGGSKDTTPEVLAKYRERVAYLVSEPDKGQSHAINKGMARATGDILTWLNSDDMLAPGALAAIALAFATNPQADIISGICCLYESGKITGRHLTACQDGPLPLDELLDLDGAWLVGQFFYQPEVFFSRSLWERAGGRVDDGLYYSMDYDLWVRFAEAGGKLHAIGRPLAWYRVHPDQKTYVSSNYARELRACRDGHLARLGRPVPSQRRQPDFGHKLKVAVINDIGGRHGAGIAHGRIAEGLRQAGHDIAWAHFGGRHTSRGTGVSDSVALVRWLNDVTPDLAIVGNLHGADTEPLLVSTIVEICPTICVLHDFWLLTGRCAYTAGCTKFRTGCDHSCPTATEYPPLEPDRIAEAWRVKRLMLSLERRPTLAAYTPSAAAFARSAFSSHPAAGGAIPNVEDFRLGIPVDVYRAQDRVECRRRLDLPLDQFIILFSAVSVRDQRKGGEHVIEVLRRFGRDAKITCCIVGLLSSPLKLPGIDIRTMGYVDDPHQLATIYGAADVFVGPSLEETFGQVFVEAAACGTPAIGYPVTGVSDAIRDGITGRLTAAVGPDYLEAAIRDVHRNADLRAKLTAWGPIYVQNEWSIEAAYRQFFLMLRRLNILDGRRVPPRIYFPGTTAPGTPEASSIDLRMPSSWWPIEGIGGVEAANPEFGLGSTFHWCHGPVSRAALHCPSPGRYVLLIEYYNKLFPEQCVSISIDGERIRTWPLQWTPPNTTGLLARSVDLTQGKHELQLSFSRWLEPVASEPRRLALAVSQIYFERAG
jgi:glycosyltransferase involved in cell wall biosynthesis